MNIVRTILAFMIPALADAQILLTQSGASAYTENFNTWQGTEISIPSGWELSAEGDLLFRETGTGSSNAGGFWAYGSEEAGWSLGQLPTNGTGAMTFGVSFSNGTAATLSSVTFTWTYEQWRYANNSGLVVAGLGVLDAADFSGLGLTASGAGDNGTPTVSPASITLSGLDIAPGEVFGIAWTTVNASGANSGTAINDFSLAVIPEPSALASVLGLFALTLVGLRRR